jgi:tetratricopeptide (TPR) repeat protein
VVGIVGAESITPPPMILAQIKEERLPAEELPSATPTVAAPLAAGSPSSDTEEQRPGESAAAVTGAVESSAPPEAESGSSAGPEIWTPAPVATDALAEPGEATPAAVATPPPPALDLSAPNIGLDLGSASLEPEIKKAATPDLAASLRVTEQARLELAKGDANTALRDLGRAVSIDPGNPFAYYYLGRTYLTRNDYAQAETFFQRAELGFTGRPDWLGETLSYAGACDEQLGRSSDAAKAYQRAVTLAPGNFRAVAGNSRLGGSTGPVGGLDAPPPPDQSAEAPPAESLPPPAPDEPEAPAPDSN